MSFKDFEIGETLGSGAFGSVKIVKRKVDGLTYAMKSVKLTSLDKKDRENSLNEIRLLASLNHCNVIAYKEAFYDEMSKTINIIMEYADGGDISSKIKQNKKSDLSFEESTIWSILIQILQGLKFLHKNKVIHRDLKSANIFLTKNGTVKIGDLNVSKLQKKELLKTQTGTPYYIAPEIWLGKPYDSKADIWSLGCIIYEMCTSFPPFGGNSLKDLYNNITKGIYKPIPKIFSSDLSKIISLILNVNPKQRPSADDLLKNPIIISKIRSKEIYIPGEDLNQGRIDLIKTIKLPKNLKDINKALPKKKYKKSEEEMMGHDEFEMTKKGLLLPEEVKKKNKDYNNFKHKSPNNVVNPNVNLNLNMMCHVHSTQPPIKIYSNHKTPNSDKKNTDNLLPLNKYKSNHSKNLNSKTNEKKEKTSTEGQNIYNRKKSTEQSNILRPKSSAPNSQRIIRHQSSSNRQPVILKNKMLNEYHKIIQDKGEIVKDLNKKNSAKPSTSNLKIRKDSKQNLNIERKNSNNKNLGKKIVIQKYEYKKNSVKSKKFQKPKEDKSKKIRQTPEKK